MRVNRGIRDISRIISMKNLQAGFTQLPHPETLFLDRDGVINKRIPDDYVKNWSQFEFLPGVKEALRLFTEAGIRLIIVTNQRGISLGRMTGEDLTEVHQQMQSEIEAIGGKITAIYHCPHNHGECECRKPQIGMFLQARRDFPEIDFAKSVMIGDSASDMEAGIRAGCRTFFITTESKASGDVTDGDAPSLLAAALFYLSAKLPE
jgi:D-glycero-D-manno-heptose 1,7-bisphosphate phosphatase